VPEAPDVPDVPEAPDVPDVPEAPDVPDVPEAPDVTLNQFCGQFAALIVEVVNVKVVAVPLTELISTSCGGGGIWLVW